MRHTWSHWSHWSDWSSAWSNSSRDLRYAVRRLARDRGFAFVAIATLTLGIGANTAIFSIVHGVLLQPLAFPAPDRLVIVREVVASMRQRYPSVPANGRLFDACTTACRSFESVAAVRAIALTLTGTAEPESLPGARASASLWQVLRVQPALGRTFRPDEDQPGRDRVLLLTDHLWRRRFNADPTIVGRTITLAGEPYEVIGVLPASFRFPTGDQLGPLVGLGDRLDFFKPLALTAQERASSGDFDFAMLGRLHDEATPARATSEIDALLAGLARGGQVDDVRSLVLPLRDQIVRDARRGLWLLLAAVAAVLVIVCLNLANLMVARAMAATRESAIRTALGASRARLMRQALIESGLLAAIGGALGIALAVQGVSWLIAWAPPALPRLDDVRIDGSVLAFGVALSMACGVLAGTLPAWRLASHDPIDALRSGAHTVSEGRRGLRVREMLVMAEVGVSALLLIVAALLITSFVRLVGVDKGFDTTRVLTLDLSLSPTRYPGSDERSAFLRRVADEVRALPGVRATAITTKLPFQGEMHVNDVVLAGDPQPPDQQPIANYRYVSADYFRALDIALIRGRLLEPADDTRAVGVVSEETAQRLWPGQDPIGRRFHVGSAHRPATEVVGVVRGLRSLRLDEAPGLMIYLPYWPRGPFDASLIVRTASDPATLSGPVRRAIGRLDAELPVQRLRTLGDIVDASVAPRRFQMLVMLIFGVAALLLAALGIYGVISYAVERRRHELGIRLALGARTGDLRRMVVRQGLRPVIIGLTGGIASALAVGGLLRGLLFGVDAHDPATIAAVALALLAIGAMACYAPARRATRVNPLRTLREP